MLSRFSVAMCVCCGSRRKTEIFVRKTTISLAFYFWCIFCFLGTSFVIVSAIATFWEFGRGFCS